MTDILQTLSIKISLARSPRNTFVLLFESPEQRCLVSHELSRPEMQVLVSELSRAIEASYKPVSTKQGDCAWCGQGVLDSQIFEHYRTTDNDIVLLHSECTERFKQFEFKFR